MKKPSLLLSLVPVLVLIIILFLGVKLFGDELTAGPSQIALITASIVGALIAIFRLKITWDELEAGILDNLSKTGSALFILLMIGALTASWIQSGVVPTMIYYGLKIISPHVFLVVTFVVTGLLSLMACSSLTPVGTIVVSMLSAVQLLGIHAGWLSGAIISVAYFVDNVSPLSDTPHLSSDVCGVHFSIHVKFFFTTL